MNQTRARLRTSGTTYGPDIGCGHRTQVAELQTVWRLSNPMAATVVRDQDAAIVAAATGSGIDGDVAGRAVNEVWLLQETASAAIPRVLLDHPTIAAVRGLVETVIDAAGFGTGSDVRDEQPSEAGADKVNVSGAVARHGELLTPRNAHARLVV